MVSKRQAEPALRDLKGEFLVSPIAPDNQLEAIAVLRRTQQQVLCGVVDPLPVDRHDDVTAAQAEAFRTHGEGASAT